MMMMMIMMMDPNHNGHFQDTDTPTDNSNWYVQKITAFLSKITFSLSLSSLSLSLSLSLSIFHYVSHRKSLLPFLANFLDSRQETCMEHRILLVSHATYCVVSVQDDWMT